MRFFCNCDSDFDSQSESEVSSTVARLHFASKCDFFQFKDVKKKSQESHNRSEFIRLNHTERFCCDCDCVSKSLRENRWHYAIFLQLQLKKSHSVNEAYAVLTYRHVKKYILNIRPSVSLLLSASMCKQSPPVHEKKHLFLQSIINWTDE